MHEPSNQDSLRRTPVMQLAFECALRRIQPLNFNAAIVVFIVFFIVNVPLLAKASLAFNTVQTPKLFFFCLYSSNKALSEGFECKCIHANPIRDLFVIFQKMLQDSAKPVKYFCDQITQNSAHRLVILGMTNDKIAIM